MTCREPSYFIWKKKNNKISQEILNSGTIFISIVNRRESFWGNSHVFKSLKVLNNFNYLPVLFWQISNVQFINDFVFNYVTFQITIRIIIMYQNLTNLKSFKKEQIWPKIVQKIIVNIPLEWFKNEK